MENKYKELTKNTLIIGIGNIGSSMISFLLIPLFTNFMTTTEYGKVDFIIVLITLIVPIVILNFTEVIIRFGLDKKYKINEVISTIMYSIWAIFGINGILIIILTLTGLNMQMYMVFSFLIFINSMYELLKHYIRAREQIKVSAIGDIIYTITFCVLNIILVAKLKKGIIGYFIAYIIANLIYVMFISLRCKIYKNIKIHYYNKRYFNEFWNYSLPLIPNSISNWIINVSDRIIIKILVGYEDLGVYSISSKVTQIINTFYGLFFKAWQISAIKELDKDDTEKFYSNIFKVLMKCMFGMAIFFSTFINVVFSIFIGENFKQAIYYIPILILGVVFYTFSSFLGTIYTSNKKSKEMFKSTVLAAILNIGINIVLIPFLGAIVACVSTLIAYSFLFIYRYFDSKKMMKLNINIKEFILYLIMYIIATINIFFWGNSNENIFIGLILCVIYVFMNFEYLNIIICDIRKRI